MVGRLRRVLGVAVLMAIVLASGRTSGDVLAQGATPDTGTAGAAIETVFDVALAPESLPTDGAAVIVTHGIWPPGATGSTSVPGWSSLTFDGGTAGALLEFVVEGSLRARVDGAPLLVWRGAARGTGGQPESIAGGSEVEIGAGDVALRPLEAPWTGRNDGAGDAVVLSVVIGSSLLGLADVEESYAGVTNTPMGRIGEEDWALVPTGPIAVTLRRATIQPGVALPPAPVSPAAPELLSVEAGVMEVEDRLPDGTTVGALTVSAGGVIPLPYPDQGSRAIRAGTEPPTGGSGAAEALIFLRLGFAPAAAAPEPVAARGVIPDPVAVGEVADTGALDLTVTAVERTTEPVAGFAPEEAFVVVRATLTPTATTVTWNLDWFEVSDDRGNTYPVAVPTDALALAEGDRLTRSFAALEPGTTYEIALVFDVPAEATGLVLQASEFAASFVAEGAPEPFAVALD